MDMIQEHKEEKRSPLTLSKALGKDEFYAKLWNSKKKYPIFRFKESGWFWTYSLADKEIGKSGENNKGLIRTDLRVKRQGDEG